MAWTSSAAAQSDFRILPYLQNLNGTGVSILWFSESSNPGDVVVSDTSGVVAIEQSAPVQATALAYPIWEINTNRGEFPGGVAPPPPYKHRVRIDGLEWRKEYVYTVTQGDDVFEASFRTSSGILRPVRFAVYGDAETEPESDGARVGWQDPLEPSSNRTYLIDQTVGYQNNLEIMMQRDLDFVAIAGDLVQSGGEQRDWDRFWRHNAGTSSETSLGGHVPLYPVPGNHEYFASPHAGQGEAPKEYRQPFSEQAMARYLTYFEAPANGTGDAREGRFYRFDAGPATVIAVDVCNNGPNQNVFDTNFQLLGEDDGSGGPAPSFAPGSPQYAWLEEQLADAQEVSPFTFILMHYSPYSAGPHGKPAGQGQSEDPLSGVPVRELTPLFLKYGVDAVFGAHDEMWERSVVDGMEMRPDGSERPHTVHFYDVGIGGDGLRGPVDGVENPWQQFLVHTDVPEVWDGPRLVDGGKHYGHLEVYVEPTGPTSWQATMTPVYAFPLFDETGTQYTGYERRTYDDVIVLTSDDSLRILPSESEQPESSMLTVSKPFPNPSSRDVSFQVSLREGGQVAITAFDAIGRSVRTIADQRFNAGSHRIRWDGLTDEGRRPAPGLYVIRLTHALGTTHRTVVLLD